MSQSTKKQDFFDGDISLKSAFEIIDPKNNLVLADESMLFDGEGTILRVSETYEKNFGVSRRSLLGRSAYELEADGTFSPCVTAEVLRLRRTVRMTQTINHTHKNVMTVGIPLFDSQGELKYVICFNTMTMEQINIIQQNYRRMQDSLRHYSEEIAELRARAISTDLLFKSPAMQRVYTLMTNIANTKANVLITGETGVGKTAVAKAIHAMSNRAEGPFIQVNCALVQESVLEGELFGEEREAARRIGKIQLADHGTLFFDEIGELPAHVQSRLLRIIQEKHTDRPASAPDLRLIAASNQDLEAAVRQGRFRSDLFYRLNVIQIQIPPLRERPEDIYPLAYHFLARFCAEYGKEVTFSPRFLASLEQYDWPGNVRQLENLIERMVITVQDPVIDTAHLPLSGHAPHSILPSGGTLNEQMDAYEAQLIQASYRRCHTTVAVAKELGISQATAARKIAKYCSR